MKKAPGVCSEISVGTFAAVVVSRKTRPSLVSSLPLICYRAFCRAIWNHAPIASGTSVAKRLG
jgi:hypothetical protein